MKTSESNQYITRKKLNDIYGDKLVIDYVDNVIGRQSHRLYYVKYGDEVIINWSRVTLSTIQCILQKMKVPVLECEEPKYYWVIKNKSYGNVYKYFNYESIDNTFILYIKDDFTRYKTQFTEKEFYKLEKELDIVGWFKRGERVE